MPPYGDGLMRLYGVWGIWRVGAGYGVWDESTASDEDDPVFYTLEEEEALKWAANQAASDVWEAWYEGVYQGEIGAA